MPPVTIQQFNHITIQDILERNQGLLNHIRECQDNGWMEEAKIYQKRLMCNISFLGCLSDALIPQASSNASSSHLKRSSMASSSLYPSLHTNLGASAMKLSSSPTSRIDIVESLPPPIMIKVPEIKEKLEAQNYVPVPPLVGNNYERDISLSKFSLMDPVVSRSVLVSRLGPALNNEAIVNKPTSMSRASQKRSLLSSNGHTSFLSPLQRSFTNNVGFLESLSSFDKRSKPALALFSDLIPEDSDLSDEEYKQPEEVELEEESQSDDDEGFTEENSLNEDDASKTQNQEPSILSNDYFSLFHNNDGIFSDKDNALSVLPSNDMMNHNQNLMNFNDQQPFFNHSSAFQNSHNMASNFNHNYIFGNPNNQQVSSSQAQSIPNLGQTQAQEIMGGQADFLYNMINGNSLIPSAHFQQSAQMHSFQQQQQQQQPQQPLLQQPSFLSQVSSAPLMQHTYHIQQQPPVMPQMNQLDMLSLQLQALPPDQQMMLIQQLAQRIQPQMSIQQPMKNNAVIDHNDGAMGASTFMQDPGMNQPSSEQYSFLQQPLPSSNGMEAQESQYSDPKKQTVDDDFFNFVQLDQKEDLDEQETASSAEFLWDND